MANLYLVVFPGKILFLLEELVKQSSAEKNGDNETNKPKVIVNLTLSSAHASKAKAPHANYRWFHKNVKLVDTGTLSHL